MKNEKNNRDRILLLALIMIVGLVVLGISDSKASIADTGVPNNEISSTVNQTDSATLTITMRTPPLPDG